MNSAPSQRRYHSFMVRVWMEDLGVGEAELRGQVQFIPTGAVRYFREWKRLNEFIVETIAGDEAAKVQK